MPTSIGLRVYGMYTKVSESDTIPHGSYCELHGELSKDVPDNIALQFLNDWKHQVELTEGLRANFIQTGSKTFIMQCQNVKTETATVEVGVSSTGAKILKTFVIGISISVLFVIEIVVMAVAIAAAAYIILSGLTALVTETGQILSTFSPEQLSGFINIIYLVIMLIFIGAIMTYMPKFGKS
jgi:hypothetical protein